MMFFKLIKLSSIITNIVIMFNIAYAETAIIKDGDTLKIGTRNIRLYGIDAPESKQKCYYLDGKPWDCGLAAKIFLENFIAEKDVECKVDSIDLYKREVAICYVENIELNQLMVQNGLAIAYKYYSKKYVPDEIIAKKQFIGIWNSALMEPEQWRRYNKFMAKKAKQEGSIAK